MIHLLIIVWDVNRWRPCSSTNANPINIIVMAFSALFGTVPSIFKADRGACETHIFTWQVEKPTYKSKHTQDHIFKWLQVTLLHRTNVKKINKSGTEQNISEVRIILTKLGFPEAEFLGLQPIKSDESSGFLKYLKQCVTFFSLPDPANQWSHTSITGEMLPSVGLLRHHHERPSPRAALPGHKA